jgi:nicotinate phosphoribosyltransferase
MQAYLEHGQTKTAAFEFFVRKLPRDRQFLMAAGLEQVLDYLEHLQFSPSDLEWLAGSGRFSKGLIDYLATLRFTCDVDAMPEGTVFFPNEPVLRVTGPLPEAQLVETRLINILHYQTLIASKAARHALLAPGKLLVDFGFRRAHGAEAGVMAARASYIAGYSGTATLLAGKLFGVPVYGTMAHSFIQTFDRETAAFEAFAQSRPEGLILLIDTYDTEAAAREVVALAPRLRSMGINIRGVRIDSGNLASLAKSVRQILDEGGCRDVIIFASGGIDEAEMIEFSRTGAPIDGLGIGTSLTTSFDVPALDCAYKLQEYAGTGRRKLSRGKATWPGRKQVWRQIGADGMMVRDVVTLAGDQQEGAALLQCVMRGGRRVMPPVPLAEVRTHAAHSLAQLPAPLRRLEVDAFFPVEISDALRRYTENVDAMLARRSSTPK